LLGWLLLRGAFFFDKISRRRRGFFVGEERAGVLKAAGFACRVSRLRVKATDEADAPAKRAIASLYPRKAPTRNEEEGGERNASSRQASKARFSASIFKRANQVFHIFLFG
jgi:hypothetical protein